MLDLFVRAQSHAQAVAVRDAAQSFTYRDLLDRSAALASQLLTGGADLSEARVAYLLPAGFDYIATQWGIWRAGGVAVPLSLSATTPELEYALTDAAPTTVITNAELAPKLAPLCEQLQLRLVLVDELDQGDLNDLPLIEPNRRAMILYTSGTTSKPKGVVSTHANIQAQIETLVEAWQWQADDSIPLFLPLHHIHGIINVMSCALWSGASIEPFEHFQMETILNRVKTDAYSVFMAVPTIYVKLIRAIGELSEVERNQVVDGFAKMRLMVSGSAALPASVHQTWTSLTGQKLLERYGMTEIGMALSNPYDGERRPGAVGMPLPNVEVRLVDEQQGVVTTEGEAGEIQIRGPSVFLEYWNRPEATETSFQDGWFLTGDMAVLEAGYYRIMGRQSVDIIKSGGYKLSALEIESALLEHDVIAQCAVVGIEDETWGEAVAAAVVLAEGATLDLKDLRAWCQDRLSRYKIPKHLLTVDALPRNAMGKVTKPTVKELFPS